MRQLICFVLFIISLVTYGCSSPSSRFSEEEQNEAIKLYEKYNGDQGLVSEIINPMEMPMASSYKQHKMKIDINKYNAKRYEEAQKQLASKTVLPKNMD